MVGCGFDAEVVHRLHATRGGHISMWSYSKPIFESIRSYQYPELRAYCDCSAQRQPQHSRSASVRAALVSRRRGCRCGCSRQCRRAVGRRLQPRWSKRAGERRWQSRCVGPRGGGGPLGVCRQLALLCGPLAACAGRAGDRRKTGGGDISLRFAVARVSLFELSLDRPAVRGCRRPIMAACKPGISESRPTYLSVISSTAIRADCCRWRSKSCRSD